MRVFGEEWKAPRIAELLTPGHIQLQPSRGGIIVLELENRCEILRHGCRQFDGQVPPSSVVGLKKGRAGDIGFSFVVYSRGVLLYVPQGSADCFKPSLGDLSHTIYL